MKREVEYKLDILVPSHNHWGLTERCIDALYQCTRSHFHLIVVDDSTDLTPLHMAELQRQYNNITFIHYNEPFKSGNQYINLALKQTKTPYMASLVNSLMVEPDWEIEGLKLMEAYPKIGIVGFKSLFKDSGNIESAGILMKRYLPCDIGRDLPSHRMSGTRPADAVQWAFALLRVEAVIGNLAEDIFYGFRGVDDIDNCFVLRDKGWDVIYCGAGVGFHEPKATRADNSREARTENSYNMETFYKRWGLWEDWKKETQGLTKEDLIHQMPRLETDYDNKREPIEA